MHMSDALVSPGVGGAMLVLSAGTLACTMIKSGMEQLIPEKKVPLMGVMSAFVFAAQMINFTIPGTGSSGHIGGGILLCALLGSYPGFISLTAVLLIQAFLFADGGLLALGCNVWNMGFYAAFVAYPLLFLPIIRKKCSPGRLMTASVLSSVVGLQLGAFSVVLETMLSGVTALPIGAFAALMQPIHLVIGLVEGLITGAVLSFVYRARPELIDGIGQNALPESRLSFKKVLVILVLLAALMGGGLSLLSSAKPDGLEWSIAGVMDGAEPALPQEQVYGNAAALQEHTALMPDYELENAAGLPGLIGGGITLLLAGGAALIIAGRKRKKSGAGA